uniref:Uncharacterized protein n=1 Tax=Haemonchus contortus TaxID=6289 RepID=A0A7I4Y6M5_HAECO
MFETITIRNGVVLLLIRLRAAHLDTVNHTALKYASETWTLRKQDEHAVSVIQGAVENRRLGITLYTVQVRARSSEFRQGKGSAMSLLTPRDRQSDGLVMTVGPRRLLDEPLGMSNER